MFDPFLSDYRPLENSRVADFGALTDKTLADVQDFLTSIRYRMQQMRLTLGAIDPSKVRDPSALAALMVDAGNLMTRVAKADELASSALVGAHINPLQPTSFIPAQSTYNALLHAMKQGAPPDGAQIQRGDYDDVVNRIKQIGGTAVDLSQMPQPRQDPGQRFLVETAPIAPFVNATAEAAKRAAAEAGKQWKDVFDFAKWILDHKLEVMLGLSLLGLWMLSNTFAVARVAAPEIVKRIPLAV
jgi:hypothetical protein